MHDKFQNPEFEKFVGRVYDLDEPIGQLIYNLWRSGVETKYGCCSGHIGKFLEDAVEGSNAFDGYQVYQPGVLVYSPENAETLTQKLESLKQKAPFSSLDKREEFTFSLEMNDLAKKFDSVAPGYSKMQIPAQLAQKRYQQFLEVWKELTDWSSGLNFKR